MTWHQDIIEPRLLEARAITADEVRIMCESGGADRDAEASTGQEVDFDDATSVFSYVFAALPGCAIVYPSERYYYFQTRINGEPVWGNLRLTDIEDGALHLGYYVKGDRTRGNALTMTVDRGLSVEKIDSGVWRVSYAEKTVDFVLFTRPFRVQESNVLRLPEERIVTGLLDESGYPLVLLYNEAASAFYYVLNPSIPLWDGLTPLGKSELLIGNESGFVFFADGDPALPNGYRLILIGVHAGNVRDNNYYDGPFDQVPPHIPLKPMLEAAYPYVVYRGGIDQHGGFIDIKDQRVAISPYQNYMDPAQMTRWLRFQRRRRREGVELILALTYESKRNFHLRLQRSTRHELKSVFDFAMWTARAPSHVAREWPPNHWGDRSAAWPVEHADVESARWPANHDVMVSRSE